MQLLTVPAMQGYIWFRQGLQIFRRNPINLLILVILYMLFIQLALWIPVFGLLAILLASPGISVSFAHASQMTMENQPVRLSIFFQVYRNATTTTARRLFWLGLIYACSVLTISLACMFSFIDFQALIPVLTDKTPLTPEITKQLYTTLLFSSLFYLPVAMLMWFSPLLIAIENHSMPQALFLSWLACWRNRHAFALYIVIWIVLLVGLPFLFENALEKISLDNFASLLLTPYSIIMLAILYCSFYASWKSCFYESE